MYHVLLNNPPPPPIFWGLCPATNSLEDLYFITKHLQPTISYNEFPVSFYTYILHIYLQIYIFFSGTHHTPYTLPTNHMLYFILTIILRVSHPLTNTCSVLPTSILKIYHTDHISLHIYQITSFILYHSHHTHYQHIFSSAYLGSCIHTRVHQHTTLIKDLSGIYFFN